MSSRDMAAFIGHVVMAMRFVALAALPECPPLPENLDDFP